MSSSQDGVNGSFGAAVIILSPGKQQQDSVSLSLSLHSASRWLPAFAFGVSPKEPNTSPSVSQSPKTVYSAKQVVEGRGSHSTQKVAARGSFF